MSGAWLPVTAFLAGVLSITSPCCVPLLPGYVGFLSSRSDDGKRNGLIGEALLFVMGFTLVFTALGATATVLGSALLGRLDLITRVAGVGIIVLGLRSLGLIRLPALGREARPLLARVHGGQTGGAFLGAAFAFGWTPCIGPVLAAILTLAASTQAVWEGTALLAVYSLGLGVPFVILAVGLDRLDRPLGFLRRHGRTIELASGTLLVLVGVGYLSGTWNQLFIPLQRWFARLGWPPICSMAFGGGPNRVRGAGTQR